MWLLKWLLNQTRDLLVSGLAQMEKEKQITSLSSGWFALNNELSLLITKKITSLHTYKVKIKYLYTWAITEIIFISVYCSQLLPSA